MQPFLSENNPQCSQNRPWMSIKWRTLVNFRKTPSKSNKSFRIVPTCVTLLTLSRRGLIFDLVQNMEEIDHVTHMHALSFLIQPNFSLKFWLSRGLKMFEISLLVQLQIVRTGSKAKLRTFSSHVIIKISERNSAGSKTKRDVYASRDLSSPYSELDQKLYPA